MCYSVNTSILSYSLGLLSAIFALSTRQIELGMLILFYCQMQLSEAIIWTGIDKNNVNLNKTGTKYGKYLLATHNIGLGIGIILATILLKKQKIGIKELIPLLIGILFFLFIVFKYYNKNDYDNETYPADKTCVNRSCQNNANRLRWPYPHSWYFYSFIISLIIMAIYINPIKSKIFLGSIFSITFLLSALIVPKSVGSVWCFSSAILAPVIVLINYFLI